MPASNVAMLFCAAKPRMMPATPAEAMIAVPNWRTDSNTISIDAIAISVTMT